MKATKRIFITLLIVSVIISAFTLTSFATEGVSADYDYLLEYYEEPTLFDYDFADESVEYSLLTNEDDKDRITSEIVSDENAPGGKYLSIAIPSSKAFWEDVTMKNNVYFNWNAEDGSIDDFIIKMTVSGVRGSGDDKQLPKIIVSVADTTFTNADDASTIGTTIVALDYRAGCFSYLKKTLDNDGNASGVYTNTDFVLTEGTWYDVSIVYDADAGAATVTVVDLSDDTNVYSVNDAYVPYSEINNVRVGAHGTDGASARDSVMNFASLYAIGGKYDRTADGLQADVELGIADMYEAFISDDVDFATKEYLAEVAAKLNLYGFTTEDEELKLAFDELVKGVVSYANGKLVAYAEAYKANNDYYEKRDLIYEALVYVSYLESVDPAQITEEIAANMQAIVKLDGDLQNAEAGSKALVEAVGSNMSIDYDDYVAVTNRYNQLHEYGQYADPTYEGTADAFVFYSTLREAKEEIETKGDKFIENVNILNSGADFNTRAQAFLVCKSNYCDNTTYPGISAALELYNYHYNTMSTQIEMAENFIKYVNKAAYADYVSAKQENLNEAKKYMGCITSDPYAGVTEAKALYDQVKVDIEEQLKNAQLYVNAVNALDSLSGDALTAAINEAVLLQEKGNVLGVEGVADANIKLDKIISARELAVKYIDYFVELVSSIDKATTTEELYKLLKSAKLAEKDADPAYESVVTASAKLAAAIADYNNQVSSANTEFVKANEVAANTCGLGKGVNPVADRVIALIKKVFDEE